MIEIARCFERLNDLLARKPKLSWDDLERGYFAEFMFRCLNQELNREVEEDFYASQIAFRCRHITEFQSFYSRLLISATKVRRGIPCAEEDKLTWREIAIFRDILSLSPVFHRLNRFEIVRHHEPLFGLYGMVRKGHPVALFLGLRYQEYPLDFTRFFLLRPAAHLAAPSETYFQRLKLFNLLKSDYGSIAPESVRQPPRE